ncbi:mannose-1-phosphate guanylyltransferase/mannose-6-phosphate isomerase [Xenorhabdus bovienii]|uniref:mannose-1-phosphate guanylyltransferase/mannose-6-phosphate isomerase n=1 Tax=Xenorhabdus bovienii TaxID=40576 RepID=UPI0023B32FDE|nr:mannose-1-phosphate guanylyltransferase/mannose-6-phosphate isomerase [Xenorhabdus bovienii]MDE9458274.1 mannose-1-phosphate guanylyltransferase/mannose-6-phosphate isomerase [Xenorhabdus bovienii]MDE9514340.1 mannose-1-phosphate guanylyltransferase/mannose-6-phosphate isomerase [Xenorhabdus bovienii]
MCENIVPIIMAGGVGSRLWPLSRTLSPKQFLNINSDVTMLEKTIDRLQNISCIPPIIVCSNMHKEIALDCLKNNEITKFILEPEGKNTAPAIVISALVSLRLYDDPFLLVLAADHIIDNKELFSRYIYQGIDSANTNLVTFGVEPTYAETGYGYIERGEIISENVYSIKKFKEKPSIQLAKKYILDGKHLWNSGIFLFKASVLLEEIRKYSPSIFDSCLKTLDNSYEKNNILMLDKENFINCPSDSIDYAVMEKTEKGIVVPMRLGWSDIGSWKALWEISPKDYFGNVVVGDVEICDTQNSFVYSSSRLVTTLGLNDIVVVETEDAVLVSSTDKSQKVKEIVSNLQKNKRKETEKNNEELRMWGSITWLNKDDTIIVRKIKINPNQKAKLDTNNFEGKTIFTIAMGHAVMSKNSDKREYMSGETFHLIAKEECEIINIGKENLVIISIEY